MSEADTLPRGSILGTRVTASSVEEALAWLERAVAARRATVMSAATVYSVMLGHDDPAFQARVNRAGYVMADGMPLVWALRLLGHDAYRVHGDDFMLACCARFPAWRHFLLGGAAGQPEETRAELCRRFPDLRIAGTHATPVRPVPDAETGRIIGAIHEADAQVVWVGMGTPTQDNWMVAHVTRIGLPLVGVGSAFDLLSGRTRPAPEWIKRSGLQWLFRLSQEPRRLAGRYLVYNPLFVWHFMLQLAGLRQY